MIEISNENGSVKVEERILVHILIQAKKKMEGLESSDGEEIADFGGEVMSELEIHDVFLREYTPVTTDNGKYYRKSMPWSGKNFTVESDTVEMPESASEEEIPDETMEQWIEFAGRQEEMEGKEFEGTHDLLEELIKVHSNG